MGKRITLVLLAFVILLSAWETNAEPFKPKVNTPESFQDAIFGLEETRANVESVSCGGWAANTTSTVVGAGITGDVPIPSVSNDLPGRDNTGPIADPTTGIGLRGAFLYPDSTTGYLSACPVYQAQMHDTDLARLELDIKMNVADPNDPGSPVSVDIVPGTGEIDINPHGWCRRNEKATPSWCRKLYEWLVMLRNAAPRPARDSFCTCPADACYCPNDYSLFDKHYCFDEALTIPESGDPVTKECTGQECRVWTACGQACCDATYPDFGAGLIKCEFGIDQFDENGDFLCQDPSLVEWDYEWAVAGSFYRHYAGGFREPNITVTEHQSNNIKEWKIRAECYDYYLENDPKECVTWEDDDRCEIVISTPDENDPDPPEWIDGDGHRQKEEFQPAASMVGELPRNPRNVPEPWVADTETNLNVIDAQKLAENQALMEDPYDLGTVAGVILPAKQRAAKSVPDNARTDMFDDTAERTVGDYWEGQQKELVKMVAEPTMKVVMPVRSFLGMSLDAPIYQYAQNIVSTSNGIVEVTLKAGLDDIGQALRFFTRNLMTPIREVRIPLVVPLASEEELSTRIFEWRQWKLYEDRMALTSGRPSFAGDADPLITRLEEYRDSIRKERLMRGALIKYLQRLFDMEQQVYGKIADWFLANAATLEASREAHNLRAKLTCIWRMIQQLMLQTDECQLQWCSNQRYSVPIYSLLDEWWGDRPAFTQRNNSYEPLHDLRDLDFHQQEDLVFDFSKMGFATGGIIVPVLWPVQAKLRLPLPPDIGVRPPDISLFPELPMPPDETIFDSFVIPDLHMPTLPVLAAGPPVADLAQAIETLKEFREMVDGTPTWWDEYPTTGCDSTTDDKGPFTDRGSMRGTYCRFIPSILIPPDPDDRVGKAAKIVHVENDLKERVQRLFSRWMPERMEDFAGRVARVRQEFPPGSPPPCREDIICASLQGETTIITSWQWFIRVPDDALNTLADAMKTLTLPASEAENPYLDAPLPILRRIFPSLDLPVTVNLIPSPPPPPPT